MRGRSCHPAFSPGSRGIDSFVEFELDEGDAVAQRLEISA
jgi:hypothetical protein